MVKSKYLYESLIIAMKHFKILLLFLGIQSCDTTETKKDWYLPNIEKDERLANISVNIFLGDDNDPDRLTNIDLRTLDGGLMNNKNTILLNNQPFELVTRKSNFYISYSQYELDDNFLKNEDYLFEIILEDSSRHTLAYIKPRKDYQDLNYNIPENFSKNEKLEVKWEDIYTPTRLKIQKDILYKEYQKTIYPNMHGYYHEITEKSGSHSVDMMKLKDSSEIIVGIRANFSTEERGKVNPNLKAGSRLFYRNAVEIKSALEGFKSYDDNF